MDDFERDFEELDKLIAQEVAKDPSYESEKELESSASVLEGAYSKISFFSETTWWDEEEVDEYRVNNLGLWSAVMGCEQCKKTQNGSTNQTQSSQSETSKPKKEEEKNEGTSKESKQWLKTSPWPASLLELYPQIPDAVASGNVSVFSDIHSEFAGDLLHLRIGNVKELIQYNRLKQDCVKNLWKETPPYEGLLRVNSEKLQEHKPSKSSKDEVSCKMKSKDGINVSSETLIAKNEICDSFKTIISHKSATANKADIKSEKSEVKIKLLERGKTFPDFQLEYEKENAYSEPSIHISAQRDDFPNQGNQCKKLKTEKLENSYARKTHSKNKTSQTDGSKKTYKITERNSSLIKENFGTFPINYQGEIIETLEEVCQWLQNVYPQKSNGENNSSATDKLNLWREKLSCEVQTQSESELAPIGKENESSKIKKILPRPNAVGDFTVFNQLPSRRLYRDVLANSEVQSCMDADPVNKFAELEREAIEQYSGCSINSEASIPLLHMDEESKFKDLEREAIEQYQAEDDSIITSGELFTPSELLKHSPISTPPRASSSSRLNIFEAQAAAEVKQEENCQECEIVGKSSSEYLLCPDSWPDDSNDNIFSETSLTKFEDNTQPEYTLSSEKYVKTIQDTEHEIKVELPIRILKPPRRKEPVALVDTSYESLLTYKNSVYTSPYESPNEDIQLEETGSKIVKFILKKKQQEASEDENKMTTSDREKSCEKVCAEAEESKIIDKAQGSTSKHRESDEDKSGQEEAKKKKKKKKRSRKKNRCKKDGGGGGGGNRRGGGGRCDARTPIHCPIPLAAKSSDSKMKRKDDSNRKDKKQGESASCILLKWQWLHNVITKLSKNDATCTNKKFSWDDLLYDEYYLEHLLTNEMNNSSLMINTLKRIPSFLFISKNDCRMSILWDTVQYRLKLKGWNYLSVTDLFSKCLQPCCFNNIENVFPSSLKWCRCFALRVGQCHSIRPGAILSPGIWRIPRGDIFNSKYWELAAGEKLQGFFVNIVSFSKVESLIYSMVNNSYHINKHFSKVTLGTKVASEKNLRECCNNSIMTVKHYKNAFENSCQKIYHLCSSYNGFKGFSETPEASTGHLKKSRNKFHRGKNNKIKGKTFCYYCSGNNFKSYTLHTFFCDVDAQNKGNTIDKSVDKMFPQPVKRPENTSTKSQQTEKDLKNEREDSWTDMCTNNSGNDDSKRCIIEECSKYYSSTDKSLIELKDPPRNDTKNLIINNSNNAILMSNRDVKLKKTDISQNVQFSDLNIDNRLDHLQRLSKNILFNGPSNSNYGIAKTKSYDDITAKVNTDFLQGTKSENEFYTNFNSNNFLQISMNKVYTQFEETKRNEDFWEKETDQKVEDFRNSYYFSHTDDHCRNYNQQIQEDHYYKTRSYNNENFSVKQAKQMKHEGSATFDLDK